MKHTPGPWSVKAISLGTIIKVMDGPDAAGQSYVDGRHEVKIGAAWSDPKLTSCIDEMIANARLMAAAPELLIAVRHALYFLSHKQEGEFYNCPLGDLEFIRQTIAKAEGTSNA